MSVDLWIYTAEKIPITHAVLHRTLGKAKWHLGVIKGKKTIEPGESPLGVDVIYDVYGAKKPAVLDQGVAAHLKRDQKTLARLYQKEGLNSVYLDVVPVDPEEGDETGPYVLQYMVNGHGGDLQYALWKELAKVVPGVMEDPQTGDSNRCGPRREKK